MILLSLPIGLAFGYAAQRGRFCINSAFRDVYLVRDSTVLRAFVLAVLIQMVGVQLLVQVGLVQVWVIEFFWLANLVGGLVFGAGMIWPEITQEVRGTSQAKGRQPPWSPLPVLPSARP